MSGLEKFQDSAEWRSTVRKFLLTERKPNPQPGDTSSPNKSQRHSFDIVDDLKIVLEQKRTDLKIVTEEQKKNPQQKKPAMFQQLQPSPAQQKKQRDDDAMEKENMAPPQTSAASQRQTFPAAKSARNQVSTYSCNETVFEGAADAGDTPLPTDESFEAMERMCDKTASDPDSTLFTYLHSDCKERVFEEAKQRSVDGNFSKKQRSPRAYDAEADALQRLLDELRVEEQRQLENESMLPGVDVTQLEDIEAPSRMWETTTISGGGGCHRTLLQTSPVKMVGLLRPSTIIEDADELSSVSDTSSAQTFSSFQSAGFKSGATATTTPSEVSSSYETAHDSTTTSSSSALRQQQLLSEIDELLGGGAVGDNNNNNNNNYNVAQESATSCAISPSSNLIDLNANQSIDLIDLERTFADLQNSSQTSLLEETLSKFTGKKLHAASLQASTSAQLQEGAKEAAVAAALNTDSEAEEDEEEEEEEEDSIILLSDGDDDEEEECCSSDKDKITERTAADVKLESLLQVQNISSTSVVADDERSSRSSLRSSSNDESNKENSAALDNSRDDKSLHFNDTMEEVDYILAKGMQQMAAAKLLAKDDAGLPRPRPPPPQLPSLPSTPLKVKQNTFLLSPKVDDRYRSPSPMLHKQRPMTGKGTAAGMSSTGKGTATATGAVGRVASSSSVGRAPPRAFFGGGSARPASSAPSSALPKPKAADRFALVIKPIPKFELFAKPLAPAVAHQNSAIPTAMRHKPFSNIVSPVGAYMKKTGSSPLITNFKSSNQNKSIDIHNTTAFRTLEYESRLIQPKFESGANAAKLSQLPERTLPKKAYISSEYRHIVDERTPVTIPGGKSIQRYLETAMLPAVVRHEGKIKLPGGINSPANAAASKKYQAAPLQRTGEGAAAAATSASKRTNASLADLSLMSGDVSMYTIMDAQKF